VPEGFHSRSDVLLSFQQLRNKYLSRGDEAPSATSYSTTGDSSASTGHVVTQLVLLALIVIAVLTTMTSLKTQKTRSRLRPGAIGSATRRQRPTAATGR